MSRSLLYSIVFTGLAAVALGSSLGACSGGSTTSPTIGPPSHTTTSLPAPSLIVSPSSIIFPKGEPFPQLVTLIPSNPNETEVIGIVKDSCTSPGIATAQQSPLPSPSPSAPPQDTVYAVAGGGHDGKCVFMFKDMVSQAQGNLNVTNYSNGGTPAPTSTPTATPTPVSTGSTGMITFSPPSVTFKKGSKGSQNVVASDPPSQYDQNTELIANTCGSGSAAIATITQGFDYGIWTITPGSVNGNCNFTIQDKSSGDQGTEYITNNSN